MHPSQPARTPPLLYVHDLRKTYGTAPNAVDVLGGLSFEVQPGEFVSIVGPSGCGKSTLFNIVGGLLEADAGQVSIDGDTVEGVHRAVGLMFQEDSTLPWRTALQNVALPLEAAGVPKPQRLERSGDMLQRLGLSGFEKHYPSELSVGMRQRVALARALVADPKLLLLDEPFAALDAQTRLVIGDQLLMLHRAMLHTTVMITHDLTEAVLLSDRILVLSQRPCRVRAAIASGLPKSRSVDDLGTDAFARTQREVWRTLRDEIVADPDAPADSGYLRQDGLQ